MISYEHIRNIPRIFVICNYARLVLADPVENEEMSVSILTNTVKEL